MQRMQRKFGAFLPRTADNAQVATLIAEFKEADRSLESLIDASKAWRDAWNDILKYQSNLTHELEVLYCPIAAVTKDGGEPAHRPAQTPRLQMQRISGLKAQYIELKNDMFEEVKSMDDRIIRPAQDARAAIIPMMKTIKKRDDRKLDYERYQSRVDSVEKKSRRSDRDNVALAKHQMDLDSSTSSYEVADENLRQTLPPVVNALLSLFPCLLEAQIEIQNNLLAHCYTTLHNYCQDHQLPSPPPELEEVLAVWSADFHSLRMEAESGLKFISTGKSIHQPFESAAVTKKSYTGLSIRSNIGNKIPVKRLGGQSSNGSLQSPVDKPMIQSKPTPRNGGPPSPQPPPMDLASKPRMGSYSSMGSTGPGALKPPNDGIIRMASNNSLVRYASSGQASSAADSDDLYGGAKSTGTVNPYMNTPIVGKKKPPPPPPKKRLGGPQAQYVQALHDFPGQADGDLAFREGDRIKVVKKTPSENDWWEGELRGVTGPFPANYCRILEKM